MDEIFNPAGLETSRKIVLVAHGVKNEVPYLRNLNFDLMKAPNLVGIVDTQSIGPSKRQIGLKMLCQAVGMEPQSLHNAGNDAAYTLRAMILAVRGIPTDIRQQMPILCLPLHRLFFATRVRRPLERLFNHRVHSVLLGPKPQTANHRQQRSCC